MKYVIFSKMKYLNLNLKNLVLKLLIIFFGSSVAYADKVPIEVHDAPKEITKLFGEINSTQTTRNSLEYSSLAYKRDKIFEEGSTSTVNLESIEPKNIKYMSQNGKLERINGIHVQQPSKPENKNATDHNVTENERKSSQVTENRNSIMLQRLSETNLDMDELVHANGTSSIKPRKGVDYDKIVPRKGVVFEEDFNHTLSVGHFCFAAETNKCYDVDNFKNLTCSCCQTANDLGKEISLQPLINCNTCLPINRISDGYNEVCNLCCENSLQNILTEPNTENENVSLLNGGIYHDEKHSTFSLHINKSDFSSTRNHISNSLKATKLKPIVTNVPYDSDIPNNHFSKSKGEKYLPLIVSICILPVIGIFIFFTWKKTRELWDRRYYKRMDFLIDGMYNE